MHILRSHLITILIFNITCFYIILHWFSWNNYKNPNEQIREYFEIVSIGSQKNFDVKYDSEELQRLIGLMYKINAFIVDIEFLKQVKINPDKKYSSFRNFKNIQQFSNETSTFLHLTFAAPHTSIEFIRQNLGKNFNVIVNRVEAYGILNGNKVLTNVYLQWLNITFQIVISYQRGNFLWFGEDENKTIITKWFGDTPRAMNNIDTEILSDKHLNLMWIPSNIDKFLYDYEYSKFIECNRTMADINSKLYPHLSYQNPSHNQNVLRGLNHFKKIIERMYKKYWIAAGGLLGWYRNCGVIPYTTDIDIAMWIEDYDVELKKALLGNYELWLWKTLGTLDKGFEMRLYGVLFDYDLFFVYKNDTYQWHGYQINRWHYKQSLYNFNELCSCEIVDTKFLVPCKPIEYLNYQYGSMTMWSVPKVKGYGWYNLIKYSEWPDKEWPYAIRYYDPFGKVERLRTIKKLNEFSKINLTELPLEDIEIDYVD